MRTWPTSTLYFAGKVEARDPSDCVLVRLDDDADKERSNLRDGLLQVRELPQVDCPAGGGAGLVHKRRAAVDKGEELRLLS